MARSLVALGALLSLVHGPTAAAQTLGSDPALWAPQGSLDGVDLANATLVLPRMGCPLADPTCHQSFRFKDGRFSDGQPDGLRYELVGFRDTARSWRLAPSRAGESAMYALVYVNEASVGVRGTRSLYLVRRVGENLVGTFVVGHAPACGHLMEPSMTAKTISVEYVRAQLSSSECGTGQPKRQRWKWRWNGGPLTWLP